MFKLHRKSSAVTEAIEYTIAGEELALGVLVKYSNGKLVKATGTDVPEYVTMGTAKADKICPVKRILEDEVYETRLSVDGSELKLGDKVTIAENADTITTTTGGNFQVIEIEATAVGSKVRGLFRR
jgi:hypothetical protein